MGRAEGKNGSFIHEPLVAERYVKISDCFYVHMWYICYYWCISEHSTPPPPVMVVRVIAERRQNHVFLTSKQMTIP